MKLSQNSIKQLVIVLGFLFTSCWPSNASSYLVWVFDEDSRKWVWEWIDEEEDCNPPPDTCCPPGGAGGGGGGAGGGGGFFRGCFSPPMGSSFHRLHLGGNPGYFPAIYIGN